MAKVNYRQQKQQREQKRKVRQIQKLERRAPKPDGSTETVVIDPIPKTP